MFTLQFLSKISIFPSGIFAPCSKKYVKALSCPRRLVRLASCQERSADLQHIGQIHAIRLLITVVQEKEAEKEHAYYTHTARCVVGRGAPNEPLVVVVLEEEAEQEHACVVGRELCL